MANPSARFCFAWALFSASPGAGLVNAERTGEEDVLIGPLASFETCQFYWISAISITAVSIVLQLLIARKFVSDPIFSHWPLQIYVPFLVADFLFSFGYMIHHIGNISSIKETDYGPEVMVNNGVFVWAAWVGCVGGDMKFVSFIPIAWAPWYAIRCSKNFKRSNMSRAVFLWTVSAFLAAVVAILGWHHFHGTASFYGLYGPGFPTERWSLFLFAISYLLVSLMLFCFFHILAHYECRQLAVSAQVDSVRRIAAESRNLAFCALGVYLLFNAPLGCNLLWQFFFPEDTSEKLPVWFSLLSGCLVKFGSWGDVGLVWNHSRLLRKQIEGNKGLSLEFSEASSKASEEDVAPLENRGVSLAFLVAFVQSREVEIETSTLDVMQKFVKPETAPRKCCYVDLVKSWVDSTGVRAVKKPQYFVSHCWGDTFCILLEQLVAFAAREEHASRSPRHYWVDIFAINQHDVGAATELPMIPRVIQSSEAVLFTLNPWHEPQTLRRVWCLWEFLQAVKSDVKVRPTMPESEELNFLKTIWEDRSKIVEMLDTVDVQHADATVLSDKEVIFNEISSTMGFDSMNSIIKANLRRCLQGVAIDRFFGFAAGSIDGVRRAFGSTTSAANPTSLDVRGALAAKLWAVVAPPFTRLAAENETKVAFPSPRPSELLRDVAETEDLVIRGSDKASC